MNSKTKKIIIAVVICLVAVSFFIFWKLEDNKQNNLDALAQCIEKSGAKFYGAFWCSHCRAQKVLFTTLFGRAVQHLPYIECSNPDGQSQTQICIDKKIESYPTWVFPDGAILTGEHSLQELSRASKCPLPQ